MHEFSVVQQLVDQLVGKLRTQGVEQVKTIHLRRGSTFAEDPLRMALEVLSENTPLKGADVVIDSYSVEHTCASCGRSQVVTSEDMIGHLFVCPACGSSKEIDEAHGLELVSVTL
jgi:Zn finger protein HypA/HybF involved in hydrogenase expression